MDIPFAALVSRDGSWRSVPSGTAPIPVADGYISCYVKRGEAASNQLIRRILRSRTGLCADLRAAIEVLIVTCPWSELVVRSRAPSVEQHIAQLHAAVITSYRVDVEGKICHV